MSVPPDSFIERVASLLGERPRAWSAVVRGYTPAARWVVQLSNRFVFVKAGTTPLTARSLRGEARIYESVYADFLPIVIAWEDDPEEPLLVIEDLTHACWPPPWDSKRIDLAMDVISRVHTTPVKGIPAYETVHEQRKPSWREVAADPSAFLSLGVCTADWLRSSLPAILDAESACDPRGKALTHLDLRSDNMCFSADVMKIVDWSEACTSNPDLDLGFWLPSLAFEGGPAPESFLPNRPDIAAWVSGFFASRAGLPIVPKAPLVRKVQREQLSAALPWLERALNLPTRRPRR